MIDDDFGDLSGLRAVVTGSSSGIGRAIARELARGGADLILHCRQTIRQAEQLAGEIQQLGRQAKLCTADLADEAGLGDFVEHVWECYGGVEVWINNAGVDLLTGEAAGFDYTTKLQCLLDVDVRSTILLSRLAGGRMRDAGRGVILNIGWDQASIGMEGDSGELFTAAKSAVMGFSRSLALSLAPTVRVNCIAPGWIKTAWGEQASPEWQRRVLRETPLERWGTPSDVARAARFLVSPDAEFVTGQVINVNGGRVR